MARLGSFSAAAIELGYTQAAVSQQIAALENDLKTQLLNRRPVTPTEAGAAPARARRADPAPPRRGQGRRHADDQDPGGHPHRRRAPRSPAAHARAARLAAGGAPPLGGRGSHVDGSGRSRARDAAIAVARGELDIAPDRRPDRPGRPAPRTRPGDRHRRQPGGHRQSSCPGDHPLAGRRPAPVGPSRRPVDRGADNVAPPLAGDPPARRRGRVPARLPLHGSDVMTLISLASAGHGLTLLPETVLPPTGSNRVPVTSPAWSTA